MCYCIAHIAVMLRDDDPTLGLHAAVIKAREFVKSGNLCTHP